VEKPSRGGEGASSKEAAMSDVNSERAGHEARESVGNRPPKEGETRVEAAMRRYLGAEMFDELHPKPEKKKPAKAAEKVEKPETESGQDE
jgi:hypothetical protein